MSAVSTPVDNLGYRILRAIRNYGVDTIFGIPGTHNLEFYRHLGRLGIRSVTARHEQGAGYGAIGWSQRTGLPGVVITTSGPGLLNVLSSVGAAFCESRPLIVLTPGPPRGAEFADRGALHETKDQTAAAGAVAGWARRVTSGAEAITAVHDAFRSFATSRPRPVIIEVPLDLLEADASDIVDVTLAAQPAGLSARPDPSDAGMGRAAALLARAAKPVILAGGGAALAGAEVRELAELLGAPVVTTVNGKGTVPEDHPLAVGAELRLATGREICNTADVLVIIGSKVGEAELWDGSIEQTGAVVRVDISPEQIDKNVRSTIGLVGPAHTIVPALLAAIGPRVPSGAWDVPALRVQIEQESARFAPREDALARRIAAVLPPGAIVGGDSSQITYYGMVSAVRAAGPGEFLYTAAFATLGFGLPASIGAAIAEKSLAEASGQAPRPVVLVIGDGALMFSVQELATAVEQHIDLTVICVDNGGYHEIEQNEAARGIAPTSVRLTQPDWAALATAFGGTGFRVPGPGDDASDGLEDTIRRALATPGLTLVHVPMKEMGK